jgi:hypothetical protein
MEWNMTKPPWYGGNKIPDSYLRKFARSVEDEGIPYDLSLFLDQLTSGALDKHLVNDKHGQ